MDELEPFGWGCRRQRAAGKADETGIGLFAPSSIPVQAYAVITSLSCPLTTVVRCISSRTDRGYTGLSHPLGIGGGQGLQEASREGSMGVVYLTQTGCSSPHLILRFLHGLLKVSSFIAHRLVESAGQARRGSSADSPTSIPTPSFGFRCARFFRPWHYMLV